MITDLSDQAIASSPGLFQIRIHMLDILSESSKQAIVLALHEANLWGLEGDKIHRILVGRKILSGVGEGESYVVMFETEYADENRPD